MAKKAVRIMSGVLLFALLSTPVIADMLDSIRVLKIAGRDGRAVIKTADGQMRVISVGDRIDGGKVTEIAKGRVVVNVEAASGPETVIFRLENDGQRIERIKKNIDRPVLQKPM